MSDSWKLFTPLESLGWKFTVARLFLSEQMNKVIRSFVLLSDARLGEKTAQSFAQVLNFND